MVGAKGFVPAVNLPLPPLVIAAARRSGLMTVAMMVLDSAAS
jgi:hypothetical protein